MKKQLGYAAFLLLPYVGLSQSTEGNAATLKEMKKDWNQILIPENKTPLKSLLIPGTIRPQNITAAPQQFQGVNNLPVSPYKRPENMPVANVDMSQFNMPVVSGMGPNGELPEPMPGSFVKKRKTK